MLLILVLSPKAICKMLHQNLDDTWVEECLFVSSQKLNHLESILTLRMSPVHNFDTACWDLIMLVELSHHDHELHRQV